MTTVKSRSHFKVKYRHRVRFAGYVNDFIFVEAENEADAIEEAKQKLAQVSKHEVTIHSVERL